MAHRSPFKRLADRLLGEPVDGFIADRRAQGESYRRIARALLEATHGEIDVTEATVRAWHQQDDDEAAPRLATA